RREEEQAAAGPREDGAAAPAGDLLVEPPCLPSLAHLDEQAGQVEGGLEMQRIEGQDVPEQADRLGAEPPAREGATGLEEDLQRLRGIAVLVLPGGDPLP